MELTGDGLLETEGESERRIDHSIRVGVGWDATEGGRGCGGKKERGGGWTANLGWRPMAGVGGVQGWYAAHGPAARNETRPYRPDRWSTRRWAVALVEAPADFLLGFGSSRSRLLPDYWRRDDLARRGRVWTRDHLCRWQPRGTMGIGVDWAGVAAPQSYSSGLSGDTGYMCCDYYYCLVCLVLR